MEREVNENGHPDSQYRANKLAQREAEKYGFFVGSDFFVDFDFHICLLIAQTSLL
jgi:hypothetical protein